MITSINMAPSGSAALRFVRTETMAPSGSAALRFVRTETMAPSGSAALRFVRTKLESSEPEAVEGARAPLPVGIDFHPRLQVHARPQECFELEPGRGAGGLQDRAALADDNPFL
jgi:hypothetical protein